MIVLRKGAYHYHATCHTCHTEAITNSAIGCICPNCGDLMVVFELQKPLKMAFVEAYDYKSNQKKRRRGMTNKETNVMNIDKAEASKRAKGYYGDYTIEARIAYSSFLDGCEWKEQQMLEKACEWLKDMAYYYAHWEYNGDTYEQEVVYDTEKLISDFKKAMWKQQ